MADSRDEGKRTKEEEYFHRKEQEAKEKTRQRLASEEKDRTKQASLMRCPKCGEGLEEIAYQDILVDRCTGCHGVWLDPGELDRLGSKEKGGWLAGFLGTTRR